MSPPINPIRDSERFQAAIKRFEEASSEDPSKELHDGKEYPRELLYTRRLAKWLEVLEPDASEPLQLAAHCQHICRWTIPRSDYPMDRQGYHQWRTTLARFHAEKAGTVLQEVGYDEKTIASVQSLLRKENLKKSPETQTLEDVICLVFLEDYFSDFARQHAEEKLITILRKTWKKMSPRGHEAALQLDLSPTNQALLKKALGE